MRTINLLFVTILLLCLISTCFNRNEDNLLGNGFWEDVFDYFEDNHFKIIHPDVLLTHPDLPSDSLRMFAKSRCKQVVVDIQDAAELNLTRQQQIEISNHLLLSDTMEIYLHSITIHQSDLSAVDFPVIFQNFDTLQKEDTYFAQNDKCGLSISGLWGANNRAVVMYSVTYSPLSGEGFLLYLNYLEQTEIWIVVKRESVWMS